MFSTETQAAVMSLQRMASTEIDAYWLERLDRAIDECVAHPERTDPAPFQRRSALANAKKVIDGRRAIRQWHSIGEQDMVCSSSAPDGGHYATVEWREWLRTSSAISATHRCLLLQLADGHDAEDLAKVYGLPVRVMRQRISRARSVARSARALDVL